MAKEVLKTHDQVFAGWPIMAFARAHDQDKSIMSLMEYGTRWRRLRRIATTELFSSKLPRDFNLCNTSGETSERVFDPRNPASVEFKDTIWTLLKLGGASNLANFFPFLAFLDPQRILSRTVTLLQKMYDFFYVFIKDRLASRRKSGLEQSDCGKDFLDVLLDNRSEDFTLKDIRLFITVSLEKIYKYSVVGSAYPSFLAYVVSDKNEIFTVRDMIEMFLKKLELFMAGSDTIATTIEWAMAELLHSPQTMKRVQAELKEIIGLNRHVEESDIDQLPYFHAVVKEVLRMHPAAPLLICHRAESRCKVAGFVIPKHTQVIMNVWRIGRDPAVWKEPSIFSPERLLEGRRICVGLPLASQMVHLVLASLLHSFEWALPHGMSVEQLDMTDEFGLTLKNAVHLEAIFTLRLPHEIY
ncbi:cytochrome P450 76T24-like [Cryptomeria japonica]|uniref:cytochrome P450 76T24-like n=1 Tax=Cryptomeria japonica TaxID=3369 RepID=UPI0027DA0974|nr:cytochrome P450 76T24-like [Cryptomeria japonica]